MKRQFADCPVKDKHPLFIQQRRNFLKGIVALPVGLYTMGWPFPHTAQALSWRQVSYVLQLNFTRFIAGVLFDCAQVVLVNYFENHFNGGTYRYYSSLPTDKNSFDHSAYKKAVIQIHPVRYGMNQEEYERYKQWSQQVVLTREHDMERFEIVSKHLVDSQTRIALVGDLSSRRITASTFEPDDLFNVNYLVFRNENEEKHYYELIEKTEVNVFDQLIA